MSNCFSCGRTFNGNEKDLLFLFKQDYLQNGTERYFYKLSPQDDLKIVSKKNFNFVFENEIKPNLINGAEYAHISEFEAV